MLMLGGPCQLASNRRGRPIYGPVLALIEACTQVSLARELHVTPQAAGLMCAGITGYRVLAVATVGAQRASAGPNRTPARDAGSQFSNRIAQPAVGFPSELAAT
jgi:hypothetical protein